MLQATTQCSQYTAPLRIVGAATSTGSGAKMRVQRVILQRRCSFMTEPEKRALGVLFSIHPMQKYTVSAGSMTAK